MEKFFIYQILRLTFKKNFEFGTKLGQVLFYGYFQCLEIIFKIELCLRNKFLVWSDQTHELLMQEGEEERGMDLLTWEYLSEC